MTGIIVPELNYRNYRTLEELQPELLNLTKELPRCEEPGTLENPLLWGVIGVLVGAVAVGIIK